jgi:hypothetical protein
MQIRFNNSYLIRNLNQEIRLAWVSQANNPSLLRSRHEEDQSSKPASEKG